MVEKKNKKTFYLHGGKQFSSLKAFAKELKNMPEDAFLHHVNEKKNDFANWIKYSLKEVKLAEKIDKYITKMELELEVLRHLVHNKATELKKKDQKKSSKSSKKRSSVSKTKKKNN